MVRGQGRPLTELKINRIKTLLATTDMSLPAIAERMGCTPGRVVSINQRFQIRMYGKSRTSWVMRKDLPRLS